MKAKILNLHRNNRYTTSTVEVDGPLLRGRQHLHSTYQARSFSLRPVQKVDSAAEIAKADPPTPDAKLGTFGGFPQQHFLFPFGSHFAVPQNEPRTYQEYQERVTLLKHAAAQGAVGKSTSQSDAFHWGAFWLFMILCAVGFLVLAGFAASRLL